VSHGEFEGWDDPKTKDIPSKKRGKVQKTTADQVITFPTKSETKKMKDIKKWKGENTPTEEKEKGKIERPFEDTEQWRKRRKRSNRGTPDFRKGRVKENYRRKRTAILAT